MENEEKEKVVPFVKQYDTIVAFLCLECIALVCFGFGGATGSSILKIIGFFVAAFAFPFIRLNFPKWHKGKNVAVFAFLGLFALSMGFSGFFLTYYGGGSVGFTSIIYALLEFMGIIGIFFLAMALRSIPVVKKEYILYAVLGGLALYCLIVGLYSLIRYGFFYAARYKGLVYYYQGLQYPIAKEGKSLVGFSFMETDLKYAVLPALVLSCSAVGLIGLHPKKDKIRFILTACFAGTGLLYLLVIPYWFGLIAVLFVYALSAVIWALHHFINKSEKAAKNIGIALLIIYGLLVLAVLLMVFLVLTEVKLGLIEKLFNGLIGRVPRSVETAILAIKDTVYGASASKSNPSLDFASLLFGYSATPNSQGYVSAHFTRFFEINLFWQNGLVGFLLFVVLILFGVWNQKRFLSKGDGDFSYRLAITSMMLGFLLFVSFFSEEIPLIHGLEFMPLSKSTMMLLFIFLLGLSYMPFEKKEESANA